jgi:hypothetical protein
MVVPKEGQVTINIPLGSVLGRIWGGSVNWEGNSFTSEIVGAFGHIRVKGTVDDAGKMTAEAIIPEAPPHVEAFMVGTWKFSGQRHAPAKAAAAASDSGGL